ncbi:MAG: hypothetical protein QM499_08670 [Flavobacteriaceae bacterium]
MIYRFRVILDAKEDVFRDIEIDSENTLEEFHNAITQAFGFEGQEMASFYKSNDQWEQGEEIALFDLSEGIDSIRIMNETSIDDVTHREEPRMIYVYDFLSMWTFLVELADTAEADPNQTYPNLMFAHGEIPDEAPEKEFKAEKGDDDEEEDYDEFDQEDYSDLDFDENWN